MLPTITKWLVCLSALAWILYDLIPAANDTPGDTISEFVIKLTRNPMVVFAFGVLTVHLMIPAGDFARAQWKLATDDPTYPLIVGMIVGLCFWSQVR